ncbi:tripartite tricarboxylate transporter TctB family protein [Paracoccus sp. S-4012]|uniref:tripartite tricarboxylate transporter TctB family protein n=1 Tax=Paracoccus sp. S-4012 TaxID=2665648 RepID=UPI0012AFF60A|nr:tripartite tricarboxylate transporter TctB family protein [Paracoccus sp. S-4012]MRX48939.1 tripartite tricarboxylate transporter TctB family protein [Paracoccus sp. S-4012]
MEQQKRPYWLAAAVALWGIVWVWQGLRLPLTDRYAYIGPGLPVVGIGAGLVILALILALQIRGGVPFEEQSAEDVSADHHVSWYGLAFAAAGAAVPMLTMRHLGFVITCMLAFWLITRAFRSPRPALDLVIGAVVSLGAWYLFRLLGVQLGGLLPIAGI